MNSASEKTLRQVYARHERAWHGLVYCYPVVSRRSGGLSIGINLNPDKACNFDCIYCQVDRGVPPAVRTVDLELLSGELRRLLAAAADGSLFSEPPFDVLPADRRRVCDIAFSGDGEPTTYPKFAEAVRMAADARAEFGLIDARLVLITDAAYLARPAVREGLRILDANNGEIWAKLDAGTEDYFRLVNRPNVSLKAVLDNILDAARERPVVIQSMWMQVRGEPPAAAEINAFCDHLNEILRAGGRLKLIQIYTIARRTAEAYATILNDAQLDEVARIVRGRTTVRVETFYGASPG